jgi:hypothetical protein
MKNRALFRGETGTPGLHPHNKTAPALKGWGFKREIGITEIVAYRVINEKTAGLSCGGRSLIISDFLSR